MFRALLAAGAAGLMISAISAPVSAQTPAAATHNDYSKSENWLCWPGRADACAIDNTATVVKADGSVAKETWTADPKAPVDCF